MIDILEEQRNLASTTSKRTYVHRANRLSKDLTCQNKGFKRIESFRPSNRRWRPDRDSNHNTHLENNEKGSKDVKTKPESKPEL